MLLLGIDFESTGLSVEEDKIIEVGAVLWDTDTHQPKIIFSKLVNSGQCQLTPEITKLTGISQEDLEDFGEEPSKVFSGLADLVKSCNYVVAHNGNEFDRPLYQANLKRYDMPYIERHWIDTRIDIPYEPEIKTRKLTHLAAEHGFLNPFSHRALFDVLTMLKVVASYDINELVRLSKEPNVIFQALCSKPWEDGGKSTKVAKEHGFYWDSEEKKWLKTCKESQAKNISNIEGIKVVQITKEGTRYA